MRPGDIDLDFVNSKKRRDRFRMETTSRTLTGKGSIIVHEALYARIAISRQVWWNKGCFKYKNHSSLYPKPGFWPRTAATSARFPDKFLRVSYQRGDLSIRSYVEKLDNRVCSFPILEGDDCVIG